MEQPSVVEAQERALFWEVAGLGRIWKRICPVRACERFARRREPGQIGRCARWQERCGAGGGAGAEAGGVAFAL